MEAKGQGQTHSQILYLDRNSLHWSDHIAPAQPALEKASGKDVGNKETYLVRQTSRDSQAQFHVSFVRFEGSHCCRIRIDDALNRTRAPSFSATTLNESKAPSRTATPYNRTRPSSVVSKNDMPIKNAGRSVFFDDTHPPSVPNRNRWSDLTENDLGECGLPKQSHQSAGLKTEDQASGDPPAISSNDDSEKEQRTVAEDKVLDEDTIWKATPDVRHHRNFSRPNVPTQDADKAPSTIEDKQSSAVSASPKALPQVKKRVDHLAGLVAVSALLVTAIHFCLTFIFASLDPSAYSHYYSEVIARKLSTLFFST